MVDCDDDRESVPGALVDNNNEKDTEGTDKKVEEGRGGRC